MATQRQLDLISSLNKRLEAAGKQMVVVDPSCSTQDASQAITRAQKELGVDTENRAATSAQKQQIISLGGWAYSGMDGTSATRIASVLQKMQLLKVATLSGQKELTEKYTKDVIDAVETAFMYRSKQ